VSCNQINSTPVSETTVEEKREGLEAIRTTEEEVAKEKAPELEEEVAKEKAPELEEEKVKVILASAV
jgi:hypothetical protein